MDGVGEVSVMITLSDDGTRIVDKDTKETSESIEKTTGIFILFYRKHHNKKQYSNK